MKAVTLLVSLLVPALLTSAPPAPAGSIYKHVDENGVTHFTNVPTSPEYQVVSLPELRKFSPAPATAAGSYEQMIRTASRIYGLDHRLVRAVIKAESNFDPGAVSHKGAMGLMQLMPETARDMGVKDPFDPLQNIFGGVRYLKFLMDRFDNSLFLALAAYNAGPEAVVKHGGIPPFEETNAYLRRVLRYYMKYKRP